MMPYRLRSRAINIQPIPYPSLPCPAPRLAHPPHPTHLPPILCHTLPRSPASPCPTSFFWRVEARRRQSPPRTRSPAFRSVSIRQGRRDPASFETMAWVEPHPLRLLYVFIELLRLIEMLSMHTGFNLLILLIPVAVRWIHRPILAMVDHSPRTGHPQIHH